MSATIFLKGASGFLRKLLLKTQGTQIFIKICIRCAPHLNLKNVSLIFGNKLQKMKEEPIFVWESITISLVRQTIFEELNSSSEIKPSNQCIVQCS